VAALAVVVLAGLAVLPAKTWFSQKRKMTEAREELARIEADTAELTDELQRLGTDDEIERRARRDFDLVYPGEESYRIVVPDDSVIPDDSDQP
jgi:cell division protein FtsB